MGNTGSSSGSKVCDFSIAGQKLKLDTAADVSEYVKLLSKARGLKTINLSGNTLGLEACRALSAAIEAHDSLQVRIFSCGCECGVLTGLCVNDRRPISVTASRAG